MRVQTTDPITGNDVRELDTAPYVIEGRRGDVLKIYFENEQSKRAYLEVEVRAMDESIARAYAGTAGRAMEM